MEHVVNCCLKAQLPSLNATSDLLNYARQKVRQVLIQTNNMDFLTGNSKDFNILILSILGEFWRTKIHKVISSIARGYIFYLVLFFSFDFICYFF